MLVKSFTVAELEERLKDEPPWIIRDFLPVQSLVDVSAPPKEGKTTFLLYLARAILDGTCFLGHETRQGRVFYLTEQSPFSFDQTLRFAGLHGRGSDFRIVFWRDVNRFLWPPVIKQIGEYCSTNNFSTIIIDTFHQFAGLVADQENSAGAVLHTLRPLQSLRDAAKMTVILSRHDRKAGGNTVEAGRGSSAYPGAMDVLYSLRKEAGRESERGKSSRVLRYAGRYDTIPDEVRINLTDGQYVSDGSGATVAHAAAVDITEAVLIGSDYPGLTTSELVDRTCVPRSEMQRLLLDDFRDRVVRTGQGTKGDPFRYHINR